MRSLLLNPLCCNRYDEEDDVVKCYANISFGPALWPLPPQLVTFSDGVSSRMGFRRLLIRRFLQVDKYKAFARLLLEGKVVAGFLHLKVWAV